MNTTRPNPDALLAEIHQDEARRQRGKLKIFLGMAAGVGKTYAMLDAAQQLKRRGVDVVVGFVVTHGRTETEALVAGLEVIPRQQVPYRGAVLEEMDTDAILARKPQLVLVDELAHTNAPGVRHVKRFQDVVELLDAGIDVHTTVNVQHFESRADAVRQITGITVHETVQDSILDLADEIELVDLSPEALRKRLADGKVYTPERIEVASNAFFRTGNLTALREMALRLTAEHVDHELQDYMHAKHIAGPWKSGDRLMVAVGPSPFSERLIRWTRRMAYNMEAPWLAVYVEPSRPPSAEDKQRLAQNLALARDLGGEVIVSAGDRVDEALVHLARQRNVSQIVVGKPRRSGWQWFLRGGSLVDRLLDASGEIDIFVITDHAPDLTPPTRTLFQPAPHSALPQYAAALVVVGVVTGIDLLALDWLGYQAVGLTELLAVLLVAVYLGRGPALLAAAVSAISWNYLFITPRFTFQITEAQDVILIGMYFVIAIFAGNLTARIRTQAFQARFNADRIMALYTLAHETATAADIGDVLRTAVTEIGRVFDAEVAVLLPQSTGGLAREAHPCSTLALDEKDFSVAAWTFQHGRPAGRFTDTLPMATVQTLPLVTPKGTLGVIAIRTRQTARLSFDQATLLDTFTNQIALAVEHELLSDAAKQSAMLRESERLYATLLNSISHELRTPLATITGAASSLMDPQIGGEPATRTELTQDIQAAADRLNRLVENLLDMSRLESGSLALKLEWCDVGDVIGVAAKRLEFCLAEHPLTIDSAPDLPLVKMDFVLMEQVVANLLENACQYTPPDSRIRVATSLDRDELVLSVSDSGPGLPPEALERCFEKFYRVPGTLATGTGLGLSVCRGLVEAHGGRLTAEPAPEGGVRFVVRLPVGAPPPPAREAMP